MMLMPLPVTFVATCTGTWVLLPEPIPGEPVAEPSAEVSAMAAPAPARTRPLVAAVRTANFLRFMGISSLPRSSLGTRRRFGWYYTGHVRHGSARPSSARSPRRRHVQPNEARSGGGTDLV